MSWIANLLAGKDAEMRRQLEAAQEASPMDAVRSVADSTGDYIQGKVDRYQQDTKTGMFDVALSGLGAGGSVIGDAIGQITQPIMEPIGKIPVVAKAGDYLSENVLQPLAQEYPQGFQRAMNVADAASFIPAVRGVTGLAKNAQMLSQNLPNQMPGFYEGGLQRVKAATIGLGTGLKNYLLQSTSPQGMADFNQRGVSRTFREVAEGRGVTGGTARERWGQAAHENLIATQYGNLNPLLAQLDNDYFVHKGVMNIDDFQANLSLPDADSGAFFRTVMANWGVKDPNSVIMVTRKDQRGAENSGNIVSDLNMKSSVLNKASNIFGSSSTYNTADKFFSSYSWAQLSSKLDPLSAVQKTAIREAYRINPKLAELSGKEFRNELNRTVKKNGLYDGKFTEQVKVTQKLGEKKTYKTNDELHKALVAAGVDPDRIKRNKDQSEDPDIYITDSVVSSMQELGGVNAVYKVGKDGKVTAVVSDDYDLFGVRGPKSKRLITVMEPIEFDLNKDLDLPNKRAAKSEPVRAVQGLYDDFNNNPVKPRARDYAEAYANRLDKAIVASTGVEREKEPLERDPETGDVIIRITK